MKKRELRFSIKDQGEGLDEKTIPYLFDPFYRADTARNRSLGGAGIGLSLAEALVKLMNGNIKAQNSKDGGAHFTLTVPLLAEKPSRS